MHSNGKSLIALILAGVIALAVGARDPARAQVLGRVNIASDSTQANSVCQVPIAMSGGGGRFVAIVSIADNLVPNDFNGQYDVFVYDRQNGQMERVSVASDGSELLLHSGLITGTIAADVDISADGRYVVFSTFNAIAPNDSNNTRDIYVRDRQTNTTFRTNFTYQGKEVPNIGGMGSNHASISDDGANIAWVSGAINITPLDSFFVYDVYVSELGGANVNKITINAQGRQATRSSDYPMISGNGQFVVYESFAQNLIQPDLNNETDIFLYNIGTGVTSLVSKAIDASNGVTANGASRLARISYDGRYIAFESTANNLVQTDINNAKDIFVYDAIADAMVIASTSSDGVQGNQSADRASLSHDGRFVAFDSWSNNLVPGDDTLFNHGDIFVKDLVTGAISFASLNADGELGDNHSDSPVISVASSDSVFVAFRSSALNLVPNDTNGWPDIFVAQPAFFGIVVNSTEDAEDINPGDGVCDTGGPFVNGRPECTLRAAIMESNATVGPDKITFEIPFSDAGYDPSIQAFRIKPQPPSTLPEITQPVIIDATTQAGSAAALSFGERGAGSEASARGTQAATGPDPTVILDGIDLGTASDEYHGLDISAGDSEVRGLAIVRFNGHGIFLHGKGNNRVQGNLIGLEPGATSASPAGNNRDGLRVEGVSSNLIGGLPESDRNVISNNGLVGTSAVNVHILNAAATANVIVGNYIGTGDKGLVAMNNTTGVFIDGAPENSIASNVIAGNQVGIRILGAASQDNQIEGNLIGVGANGTLAVPNERDGILIEAASYNIIGGTTARPGSPPGNVISGNRAASRVVHGIRIVTTESKHNIILGNLIGTDRTGKLPLGNGGAGVYVEQADSNEIGGLNANDANVIADNDSGGVFIRSSGNTIFGNRIGTDIDGHLAIGNKHYGIRIDDNSDNRIHDNVVSGNEAGGILIQGNGATHNEVLRDTVGTTRDGLNVLANKGHGIHIRGAHANRIESSLLSGNDESGIALSDSSSGNVILDNYIGVNRDGDQALANMIDGVHIHDSPYNTVEKNTASANTFSGIHIEGAKARANTVTENYLGVTGDGLSALGNGEDGVFLWGAPDNRVVNNILSANGRYGVFVLASGATGCDVNSNMIGVSADSTTLMGNVADGIRTQLSTRTQINNNIIADNGFNGICITNVGEVTQDTVWTNTIFANRQDGIRITGGTGNSIRFNEIYFNTQLGIDLEDAGVAGVTPNDPLDVDTGPNNLQNFPRLKFAFEDTLAGTTTLIGVLESAPNATHDIDLFDNAFCDPTDHGEGEIFFDTFPVTTGSGGVVGFVKKYPYLLANGLITATATDAMGNTSEFSECVVVEQSGPVVIVNSTGDGSDIGPGDGLCDTGNITPQGEIECTLRAAIEEVNAQAGNQTVIFDIPGGAPQTIAPTTALPTVQGPAELDATTQNGFSGEPVIEIDGSGAAGTNGFTLAGGGVSVRGFVINRFNGHGVVVGGNGTHVIELDYIGTDVTGTQDLGNKGHGVMVNAGDNSRIGGMDAATGNVIAFNDSDGVHVTAGRANAIVKNSIHTNDGLGINLVGGSEDAEGVTVNDSGDGDAGPNDLQNYPVLSSAAVDNDELQVEGDVDGVADATYHIDVFGNAACDASGNGEGKTYLGTFDVTLTGGATTFVATLALDGKSTGGFITATATDEDNNTSEFSPCIAVAAAPLELSLGVLQNPFLSQFLDIFMVASDAVDPQSVVLTVGGEDVPMTLADASENLWKGDYELDGGGALLIEACATSLTGSDDCASTSVAALFVVEGRPFDLRSVDGHLAVRVAGGDVTEDGFVVIVPATASATQGQNVADAGGAHGGAIDGASDALAGYTVSALNLAERVAITVEFDLRDLDLDTDWSQLFIDHVGVRRLASVVDLGAGVIRATAERPGTYVLRAGETGSSSIADVNYLRLDPNYPNPFNPSTTIQYELQTAQHVRLTVYDASGRRISRLVDEIVPAGTQRFRWNATSDKGRNVASGVYFIRLESEHGRATRKLVLIR